MKFNNLSTTLKGGIIGTLVGVILTAALYYASEFGEQIIVSSQSNPFPNVPIFIKSFSVWILLNMPFRFGTGYVYRISGFLILLLIIIIIGTLIGLLIEKIKSKK